MLGNSSTTELIPTAQERGVCVCVYAYMHVYVCIRMCTHAHTFGGHRTDHRVCHSSELCPVGQANWSMTSQNPLNSAFC